MAIGKPDNFQVGFKFNCQIYRKDPLLYWRPDFDSIYITDPYTLLV